jgi:hypothetical protein
MTCRRAVAMAILVGLLASSAARTQPALPLVEDAAFEPLRQHGQQLLQALDALRAPLPAATTKELQLLLAAPGKDPEAAATRMQQLLDAHCLISVSINPESRVKAARGPARAELVRDRPVFALVKVHNDAGVTHALTVSGPQLRRAGQAGEGRWLEAVVHAERPLSKTLSGQKVEYVILRLTAHETGKREATLHFDVGQGTQDLGFRAEVPVLFTIRKK